ncbi:MAG: hypothetical protein ACJA13_004272 [Paraglaciecola sp.]|jgi:hypothetical protein
MLLLILLAVIVAVLFVYSLARDTGKNTKFARKGAKAQGDSMGAANMVELS